jgi:hypothetical protein
MQMLPCCWLIKPSSLPRYLAEGFRIGPTHLKLPTTPNSGMPAQELSEMEQQHHSGLRLIDEQAAEVRRRLADPSKERIPAEDVFRRFRSRKA